MAVSGFGYSQDESDWLYRGDAELRVEYREDYCGCSDYEWRAGYCFSG